MPTHYPLYPASEVLYPQVGNYQTVGAVEVMRLGEDRVIDSDITLKM